MKKFTALIRGYGNCTISAVENRFVGKAKMVVWRFVSEKGANLGTVLVSQRVNRQTILDAFERDLRPELDRAFEESDGYCD